MNKLLAVIIATFFTMGAFAAGTEPSAASAPAAAASGAKAHKKGHAKSHKKAASAADGEMTK